MYVLDLRNLQKQVKKYILFQKLYRPFTFRKNCSNDLKNFANFQPLASNFSQSLEIFFLTVG